MVDGVKLLVLMVEAILLISSPGVIVIGVPLPFPGSVLIKYSAATIFCGVAGGAG